MSNQKAIERIKKLMRLASKSTSKGEAANALSQAQKLMAKHGLQTDSPELAGVNEVKASSKTQSQSIPTHISALIRLICSAFGCHAIRTLNDERTKLCITFVGHAERPTIAQYAYEVLERQLLKARKEYLGTLNKRIKQSTKVARADVFCVAWVMAVDEKVQKMAMSDDEIYQITTYRDNRWNDTSAPKTRQVSLKNTRGGDTAAMMAGHAAGSEAQLNHGVDGRESEKLTVK